MVTSHTSFQTVTRGIDRSHPAMRLFEKAKVFGIWNPTDIDLTQDHEDWAGLDEEEQTLVLRLLSLFVAGEEAVTLDLLPLIMTVASENRLEEEMFLTTFLWEEAKHVDFFNRIMQDVVQTSFDRLEQHHTEHYHHIFYRALPEALSNLTHDPSPQNQLIASVTYNMIVEGVLAETGYHAFYQMLERNNIMPGLMQGIQKLKQDESRHIAYGIFLISRLVAEDASLWQVGETQMNTLFMPAMGVIQDIFALYEDEVPFGLKLEDFMEYATGQFQKRFARILTAQSSGDMEQLFDTTNEIIEANTA